MSVPTTVTPESLKGIVTINNKQDKITTQELFDLVKSLTILDKDSEVNITKIGKVFGKRVDKFKQANSDFLDEIAITQNGVSDVIREKRGGAGEQGTFTSSSLVLLEFIRYCNPRIAVKMNSIVSELFTKGYTSIDGQSRLTQKEYLLVEQLAGYYQYTDNIDIECENAIKTLANKYNGDYAKANIEFNKLADYDLKEVRTKYEQACLVYDIKCLKLVNKKDMTFIADPYKLVANSWIALCINNNITNYDLGREIVEFLILRDISLTKDCTTVGLMQQLQPNNSLLRLNKNSNIYKQLMNLTLRI